MTLRCSSLPLAFRCPGSVHGEPGDVLIDTYQDAATDGTDVHRLLASHPEGDAPKELLGELSEDARILYYTGAKMWREHISPWMPESVSEVFFEAGEINFNEGTGNIPGDELSGHVDKLSVRLVEQIAAAVDWKSGRKDSDYREQGAGYAFKVFRRYPMLMKVTVHFAWLRTQELESYAFTRERIMEWAGTLDSQVIHWDGVYHPGEHCSGCKRFASCPAHAEMNRQSLATISGHPLDLATMPGPELATLYRRLGPLEKQIEILKDAMRAEVKARGEVDDGAGRVLHYVEQNAPREVDPLKAWPALTAQLTDAELAACVTVSIGAVEEAVAEKAAKANPKRGAKKEAKEALQAALEKVGAVSHGKVMRFKDERRGE